MKKAFAVTILAGLAVGAFWWGGQEEPAAASPPEPEKGAPGPQPNDWFWRQRAYPSGSIDYDAVAKAAAQARVMRSGKRGKNRVRWELVGPTNTGGRITDVEIDQNDRILIGTAFGGVWTSTDQGASWMPIFDGLPSLAIGDIALAPSNHDVIYVGSGEANGGGNTYGGTGVYKSVDGGATWLPAGLPDSRFIGRIVVHPSDPDLVYVAAMGELYGPTPDRGLYRSRDGGFNWEKVLFVSERAGFIDAAIDPLQPDTVYAVSWDRERGPGSRVMGGVDCGIWRSQDGGDTWTRLGGGLPAPADDVGRIGIAVAPSDPQTLYAIYADQVGFFDGLYKSTDGGDAWTRVNDAALQNMYANFGWFFGNVRVHPEDPDTVFAMGQTLWVSGNGGASWKEYHTILAEQIGQVPQNQRVHVDHHGLAFSPNDANVIVLGNDGGAYVSAGENLRFAKRFELPITQFYAAKIDPNIDGRYYGGTQDNGTIRTPDGRLDGWELVLGGDGFRIEIDPRDSGNFYVEFQFGGLFQVQNGQYTSARSALDPNDRFNWNSPMALDPSNPDNFYFGGNRLYATSSGVTNLTPISGDLSNGPGSGNLAFGTSTAIAVAPSDGNVIYVGLDDGNLWVTPDRGGEWIKINAGLPERWVTSVAVDPRDADVAYVSFSGYPQVDFAPHLFRTEDRGQTWVDVSGNLPNAPVNDVVVDNVNPDTLYAATDMGVFFRRGLDRPWRVLGAGLPLVATLDLDLHGPSRRLAAATFGRSMYVIDVAAATAGDDVQGSDLAELRWLPGVDQDAAVAVVNPNGQPVELAVYGFTAAGEELARSAALTALAPQGKARLSVAELFPDSSGEVAWVQVAGDLPVHAFAELQDAETRSAFWAAEDLETRLYAPHVARDTDLFRTDMAVINGGPFGARHTASAAGREVLLPEHYAPYAQAKRDVREWFGFNLQAVDFVELTSDRASLAAMEFFTTLPGQSQKAALGLTGQTGSTLRFLHAAADLDQFWTGMVYINLGEEAIRVTERYYNAAGSQVLVILREPLPPRGKRTLLYDRANLGGIPDGVSWVDVIADGTLIGYELFGAPRENQDDFFAGLQGNYQSGLALDYPHVVNGVDRWTGLVAVNVGEEAADIAFTAYNAAGEPLETATVNAVAPKVKLARLLESLFSNPTTLTDAAWVRAEASGSAWAGFALWGDRGGASRRFMSGLTAAIGAGGPAAETD